MAAVLAAVLAEAALVALATRALLLGPAPAVLMLTANVVALWPSSLSVGGPAGGSRLRGAPRCSSVLLLVGGLSEALKASVPLKVEDSAAARAQAVARGRWPVEPVGWLDRVSWCPWTTGGQRANGSR